MLTRMYLYSTSTKLSIDVWLYLDRPGSLNDYRFSSLLVGIPESVRDVLLPWQRGRSCDAVRRVPRHPRGERCLL